MTESPRTTTTLAPEITLLLQRCSNGDAAALNELLPHVYGELRRLAQYYLRGNSRDCAWQPTELVHEVYLRLFHGAQIEWESRAHFFHIAGNKMRWLMVDEARRALTQKRGEGCQQVALEHAEEMGGSFDRHYEMLALNEALTKLEKLHPRTAQIVELRYFAGLNEAQTAQVMQLGDRTVRREWAFARGWLLDQLGPHG